MPGRCLHESPRLPRQHLRAITAAGPHHLKLAPADLGLPLPDDSSWQEDPPHTKTQRGTDPARPKFLITLLRLATLAIVAWDPSPFCGTLAVDSPRVRRRAYLRPPLLRKREENRRHLRQIAASLPMGDTGRVRRGSLGRSVSVPLIAGDAGIGRGRPDIGRGLKDREHAKLRRWEWMTCAGRGTARGPVPRHWLRPLAWGNFRVDLRAPAR
jgi:hypothetical protein